MDSLRRPGAFSPFPTPNSTLPIHARPLHQRSRSSESDSSGTSQATTSSSTHLQQAQGPGKPVLPVSSTNASSTSVHSFSRPSITQLASDLSQSSRHPSPLATDARTHKRNNSQGFFEPSLPTASPVEPPNMPALTASQIAAQAAMQHQQRSSSQHARKRSQTVPNPQSPPEHSRLKTKPPPLPAAHVSTVRKVTGAPLAAPQSQSASANSPTTAATTAANAAFPRNAQLSPGLTSFSEPSTERDPKAKSERSKIKLFSKPKHIGIPGYKDMDRKDRPLPSPVKAPSPGPSLLSKAANTSTASLIESTVPAPGSLYSISNSSTSTLVAKPEDKEKAHRHHFLSRQKNKFKDRGEDHSLTLSSASSNSRPVDPSAPQSIYSFAPASPGPTQGTFAKSVSGLDLRHGGRALRDKWREDKAATVPETKSKDAERHDWVPGLMTGATLASSAWMILGIYGGNPSNLQGFGVPNMAPEDAWDYLKAKLLAVFGGEDIRTTIEDLNKLVFVHLQRCYQQRSPTAMIEDLRDLLQTGFSSLDHTLSGVPGDRLVPYLVEMWLFVFGSVLPFVQAVFLPLDLEFRGVGPLMTFEDAAEFWGFETDETGDKGDHSLDVQQIVLLEYRDVIVLPRHDALTASFSRLSLESFDVGTGSTTMGTEPLSAPRPGTGGTIDPTYSSFNSQGSTLLGDGSGGSGSTGGARSRTTSNTSAPELPSFGSANNAAPASLAEDQQNLHQVRVQVQLQADSARVTESVARMLQCMSVLVGLRSGDAAQEKTEALAKALKLNWLGRGRTGRNRKGFVGARPGRSNRA